MPASAGAGERTSRRRGRLHVSASRRRRRGLRILNGAAAACARRELIALFFLRCPNAETLSRHEPPDCGAKRGIMHAQ
ncbi:hypothetical protein EVAR_21261_1 [Eumeta japonica]|uniref:Uncharacterized protein n=1 Tax=Eumeta variegata TaxID=151549 RepID=A0A4C1WMP8_EUMVA|nr:hypothetical protein EVAR_21261_1 [Eumeta japonica]